MLTLIKDINFQVKYNLSSNQTDIMSYIIDSSIWADNSDGFYAISTKKIMQDLPYIGATAVQSIITKLSKLGLITKTRMKDIHSKHKIRGIKITKKGEEYSSDHLNINQENQQLKEQQEESQKREEELQLTIDNEIQKEKEKSQKREEELQLTIDNEIQKEKEKSQKREEELQLTIDNEIQKEKEKSQKREEELQLIIKKLQQEREDFLESIKLVEDEDEIEIEVKDKKVTINLDFEEYIKEEPIELLDKEEEDKEVKKFIKKVMDQDMGGSEPLCDGVPNYQKTANLYLMMDNGFVIINQDHTSVFIEDPIPINEMWTWLFYNHKKFVRFIDF